MKLVFLVAMLVTMLFSNEKQIIVGSFVQDDYAANALVRLNKHILNDKKLSKLINKNSVQTELKKLGEYNAVSLWPFTSYVELLRTLRALEKYYDDAYVLDNGQKIEIAEVVIRKELEEKIEPPLIEIKKQEPKVEKPKVVEEIEVEEVKAPQTNLKDEIQDIQEEIVIEEESDFMLEMLLIALLLIAVGFIFYKKLAQKKDEEE